MHTISSSLRTRVTIAAAALSVMDALGLCVLSHIEHLRSIRPSAIINAYMLLTLPFDVARTRTLWIDRATDPIAALFTSTLAVKVLILVTEAFDKRHLLLERYRHFSPESTSGIYSRSFFWWLNTLMRTGFHRVFQDEDLYPIDGDMRSVSLYNHAQAVWDRVANKHKPRALFWSTLKANRLSIIKCVLPRLCLIGFTYTLPFLLTRTINFADSPEEPDSIGWGLTGAFALVFLGLAVANGVYAQMANRLLIAVRGSCMSNLDPRLAQND